MPIIHRTSEGVHIVVQELPHTRSVSLGCFVGVGARHEPAPMSGISHLIEHMCFKGTRQLPTPRAISEHIEHVGGILDAATSHESTVYWAKVADVHSARALHVVAELTTAPQFAPHELEKERRVVIEELRGYQDVPSEWVHTMIQESLWGAQPLGRDIAGSAETVGTITHADLLAFWQRHYCPGALVCSVAGNVRAADAIERISTAFTAFSSQGAPDPLPALPTQPPLTGPRVSLLPRETEQANFCLAFPALSYHDPDRRALDVLDTLLGDGMASRLFLELREERGLAYSIGSYHHAHADAGCLVIYGSVDAERLTETIAAVLALLGQLVQVGISTPELHHMQEQIKGGMLLALEDTWSVAARNGSLLLRFGAIPTVEDVVAQIAAVREADVLRVARRVLRPDALHLAVIGPYVELDEVRTLVEGWSL